MHRRRALEFYLQSLLLLFAAPLAAATLADRPEAAAALARFM